MHILVHETDVVVLWHLAVLLQIRTPVLRHAFDQVVDHLVWDQRMSQIELCDVWLLMCQTVCSRSGYGYGAGADMCNLGEDGREGGKGVGTVPSRLQRL